MKQVLQGIVWLKASHFVFASLFGLLAVGLDYTDLFRSLDRAVEYSALYRFFLPETTEVPFVLLSVDTKLVDQFGCPPYEEEVLQEIEKSFSRLEIERIILPDGDHTWLNAVTRANTGSLTYLVPSTLHWDSYAKRLVTDVPKPNERVQPIVAYSQPLFNEDGFVPIARPLPGLNIRGSSFPFWLAKQVRPDVRRPADGEFIRFLGPAGSVPTLPLSRIVTGEFDSSDVGDRIAVLGISSGHCVPQMPVPTDPNGMSSAEVQMHAAASLFKSPLKMMKDWQRILLIVAVTFLVLFGISRVRFGFRLFFVGTSIVGGVALSMAIAYYFHLLIPIAAPLVAFFLVYVYFSIHNTMYLVRELRDNNTRLGTLIETWAKPSESREDIPARINFEYLLEFSRNFLEIDGAYLFVLPLEAYHYRLFLSINCNEEDIRERRRDIRRMPWLGAISSPTGAFLRGFLQARGKLAYGIPIFDYGVVLGMVVLVLPPETDVDDRMARVLSLLSRYMGDILLGARAEKKGRALALWRTLQMVLGRDTLAGEVSHAHAITHGVQNQLDRYRLILDRTTLGIMVSDLIGHVFYMNQHANDFMVQLDPNFTKKLSDFINILVKGRYHSTSSIIEALVLGEEVERIEWTDEERGRTYNITFSGISTTAEKLSSEDESISAVLVTINDVTISRQIDKLKSQVLALASKKGKKIIEGVRTTLVPSAPWAMQDTSGMGAMLENKVDEIDDVFEQFTRLSRKIDVPHEGLVDTPFDVKTALDEVMQELVELAEKRRVKLVVRAEDVVSPAFGSWNGFKQGLFQIVKDIIQTCYANQRVTVTLFEADQFVHTEIIDPSSVPDAQLLQDITKRNWENVPEGLVEGLRTWDKANILFGVAGHQNEAMRLVVSLQKA